MKTFITLLLSIYSLSLTAQNVNITFANKNRNYQVVIDGNSYYSTNSVSTNGRQMISVPGLSLGAHNLEVYDMTNSVTSSEPVYTKTFQLRQGYDMNIAVRANGLVSFTEKKSKNEYTAQTSAPMSSTAFSQLVQSVQAKRYQSDKINIVRNAFNKTGNYFTSAQVRQLLLMINAESRRLELAKLAYAKVTDKANFTYAYDALKSEASREALDDYVVAQGGYVSTEGNTAYATAMNGADFNELLSKTRNYLYQTDRITEIKTAFTNSSYYFSTAQIKQLLSLVTSESDRLALAKSAYMRVTDKSIYNQLVDLFYTQANRDDLNSFIVSNGGVANTTSFKSPMSDAGFTQIYNKARSHFFQKNTINDIRNALNNTSNNFSTEQIRQLLLLVSTEPNKLELAKLAYARVVDPINFPLLLDLFTIQSNRVELDMFIKAQQQ